MTPAEIEELLFTGAQGADWGQSFTHTSGDEEYDPETLLIQIRAGDSATSTLIASSVAVTVGEDEPAPMLIDTTGTDLESAEKTLVWAIEADQGTAAVAAGRDYWIEIRAEVNGVYGPIMKHRWFVPAMVAVG